MSKSIFETNVVPQPPVADSFTREAVIDWFLAAALKSPASVAVRLGREALTYSELKESAMALACRIRQAKGGAEGPIAIMADRNFNLIVAVVAAALSDSPCVVLSTAMWKHDLALAAAGKLVVLEEKFAGIFPGNSTLLIEPYSVADLATPEFGGKPEGQATDVAFVLHANRGVIKRTALAEIIGRLQELQFPTDCIAQVSDISSAVFPLECWAALTMGGIVLLAPQSANAIETLKGSSEMALQEGLPISLVLPTSVANALITKDAKALEGTKGLLLLGVGLDPENGDELASCAKERMVLVAITGADSSPAFVGRIHGDRVDPVTAVGVPVASASTEIVGPNDIVIGRGMVGELHVRTESGDLVPIGVHGQVRRDGKWEVFVSAEWQTSHLREPQRGFLVDHWRERLKGIPVCCELPIDRSRPPIQSRKGAHIAIEIPSEVSMAVESLASSGVGTEYAILLGALSVVLQRYAKGDDVVIGTPAARNEDGDVESAIAPYANPLILRLAPASAESFSALVTKVDVELRDALDHEAPYDLLVKDLNLDKDSSHQSLFQVLFTYSKDWRLNTLNEPLNNADFMPNGGGIGNCDFKLHVVRSGPDLKISLEYAKDLFDQVSAMRMGDHFLTLLLQGVSNPDRPISNLDILPNSERSLLVERWARGEDLPSEGLLVHQLIAAQVERTPNAVAVVHDDQALSYRELNAAAEALAGRLRDLGVSPGSVVGVYLDRSALTVVALLGILKAGAAYLPLDAAYPSDRLSFMVADSGAAVVVSRFKLLSAASEFGATVVLVDAPRAVASPRKVIQPTLDNLAYLIYTSGSTGRPKGVKVSHRNLATFLGAMDSRFGADNPGTWLAVTSISFDISVLELLWTLTRGYRVIVRSEELGEASTKQAFTRSSRSKKAPDLSLFFFGNVPANRAAVAQRYRLVLDAARFGDENGFKAVWTPERHFHEFGGLYPNPAVLAGAIAATTQRIDIRAGSVVLPLHDPLRVAEDWALVDNLSGGRVGVAFASGWQPDDFVLAPDRYADRKESMLGAIEEVRRLWRGERVRRRNGVGTEIEVKTYPRAIQDDLPVWVTSARHPDTFRMAAEAGAGVLTHLIGHSIQELSEKIAIYREEWRKRGNPGDGHVTLMLHTYVGEDLGVVKDTVRQPLKEYIRTSLDLMAGLGAARNVDMRNLPEAEIDELLDQGFERFFATSGLLGDIATVVDTMGRIEAIGVDEIACLVDFGVDDKDALISLKHLSTAKDQFLHRRAADAARVDGGESFAMQLRRHEVTHLQCTPTLAGLLTADPQARAAMNSLRRLLVGGEALPPELATSLGDAVGGSVHNMYGPTEATVWATSSVLERGQPVVIGRPLPGYRAYVVDDAMRLSPIGVPGELLLGGSAVALGYHGRDELTDEKFIPDGLSGDAQGRLYRTGDVVRWRASGDLEFLGRVDHQVKLRGRRIELGEIEVALSTYSGVQRVVCDVRGEDSAKKIVAYFVLAQGVRLPDAEVLREFAARVLPDYMVPAAYVQIDALPLTPNGKVNRRGLPDPGAAEIRDDSTFNAPIGDLEQSVAAVWRQVLRLNTLGRDDDFFKIGGNSIQVVAVRNMMVAHVGSELTVADIFRYPTVAGLAAAITDRGKSQQSENGVAARAAEIGERRRAAAFRNRSNAVQAEKVKQ